jgi:sulfhydrogenase subunit alpha
MTKTVNVAIKHLTRVEGHGNINIKIKDGKLLDARWEVIETPRFFEAILVGKNWDNAPVLTSRICGICSVGHTLASIRAVENAFGIKPTRQTQQLRLLLKHMETLQSHVLHLCFLVLPDFMNAGSVFPLIKTHGDLVLLAARLKKLANDACDCIGGRRLHPTRPVVGGFTALPKKEELDDLSIRLKSALDDLTAVAELFAGFSLPDFERETEFVSLKGKGSYPFIGGDLVSSDGLLMKEKDYKKMTNEFQVEQSTSKWCRLSRDSFAVGALARVNNNFDLLYPEAKEAARALGLTPLNYNPYMNNIAQLVECLHVTYDSINIINELVDSTFKEPRQKVKPKKGIGVSAVEVPRGILYHCYEFDNKGKIVNCDCVIPTGQNHANIQLDLESLATEYAKKGKTDRELELLAAMLVRAYDPCISCSVH